MWGKIPLTEGFKCSHNRFAFVQIPVPKEVMWKGFFIQGHFG